MLVPNRLFLGYLKTIRIFVSLIAHSQPNKAEGSPNLPLPYSKGLSSSKLDYIGPIPRKVLKSNNEKNACSPTWVRKRMSSRQVNI
jgi:hypothetical protein